MLKSAHKSDADHVVEMNPNDKANRDIKEYRHFSLVDEKEFAEMYQFDEIFKFSSFDRNDLTEF